MIENGKIEIVVKNDTIQLECLWSTTLQCSARPSTSRSISGMVELVSIMYPHLSRSPGLDTHSATLELLTHRETSMVHSSLAANHGRGWNLYCVQDTKDTKERLYAGHSSSTFASELTPSRQRHAYKLPKECHQNSVGRPVSPSQDMH